MDSTQLYTNEDTGNILDNNTTAWINNPVLVDSENIVWHENGPEITVDYSEITDQSLTENEGYVTANTEVDEASEYFSILSGDCNNTQGEICAFDGSKYQSQDDASECIMNIQVENEEVIIPDLTKVEKTEADEDKDEGDVILYQVEGKDEWYAQQVIDDGSGQLKTYRYKVSQNADGQFEAIPGTLEVQEMYVENYNKEDTMELDQNVTIKQEQNSESDFTNMIKTEKNNTSIQSSSDVDESYGDLAQPKYSLPADNVTQFAQNYLMDSSNDDNYYEDQIEYGDSEDSEKVNLMHEDGKIASISVLSSLGSISSESEYEIEELEEDFQDDFTIKNEYDDTNITEILGNPFQPKETVNEFPEPKPVRVSQIELAKNFKNRSYYLINVTEKENISLTNAVDNIPTQFKSILKSNFASNNVNCPKPKTVEIQNPQIPATVENEVIEKTPIVKKSSRPPRKQVIIPVERAGSEIIVQPLIYPLENIPDIRSSYVKRSRISKEIYQVSDESDPEFTLKPVKKKKFKRSKPTPKTTRQTKTIEITISDTDEENTNENYIINLLSDQDSQTDDEDDDNKSHETKNINTKKINNISETDKKTEEPDEKKKPPCNTELMIRSEDSVNNTEKKTVPFPNTKVEDDKKNTRKNNIKCPICPKTFPRQANLKSHMNIHSARRVLRSKIMTRNKNLNSINPIKNDIKVRKSDYYCEKCRMKFMTEAQYVRHQTVHPKTKLSSSEKLQDETSKVQNKSVHEDDVNENSKNLVESKCRYCDVVFYSKEDCAEHENAHKTYPCPKCMTIFTAKTLLDKHMKSNACKHKRKKIFNATGVKCLLCKKVFCSAETLKKHTSLHHKGETIEDGFNKKYKGLRSLPKKPNKKDD